MIRWLEDAIFDHRPLVILLFLVVTIGMGYYSSQLRVDAGFNKLIPLQHEYMQTFAEYREFGGANRVLIALIAKDGNMFSKDFFQALQKVTDEVFFIPGVERGTVTSLFTPNVRFTEVVEEGIAGGNVIPDDFAPTVEGLAKVRENILKADIVGRLVANDFSGAIVSFSLQEIDPNTGEKLDYSSVATQLETVRTQYSGDFSGIDLHIIGFAKVIGDITDGAKRVIQFFGIAFLITGLLVFLYAQSIKLSLIPLACSLVAVIWQLGMLPLLGFGIDPMSILVPFLVFAIGVSHGVQMISSVGSEVFRGADSLRAARNSFRRLLVPGGIALASDTIGFIIILLIKIDIIQEMAITASLGVAAIIFTNLILLPVLVTYVKIDDRYREKLHTRSQRLAPIWKALSHVARPGTAMVVLLIAAMLFGIGIWKGTNVSIGDLHSGVPELRPDSRYNLDSQTITQRFSIGVDVLAVIVETQPEGCVEYEIMTQIDRFAWYMRNVEGVQSVADLPDIVKVINAGWNEGSLEWRVLPRDPSLMAQSLAYIPTSTGLLNNDCSVMPVYIFTRDHKAETIEHIVDSIVGYSKTSAPDDIRLRLAAGNVGVMAATNEEVEAAQFPILIYVFSAIILLCLITFRTVAGTLCIVIPLALVSLLAYALMSILQIGLKVNTLPVVALGVGIGVDYGIYIFSRLRSELKEGRALPDAYLRTLATTGNGVVFTGVTLAMGVATWIFSPLKFQADMGILLTFMFLVNMLGAIFLLPALANVLIRHTE